VPSLTSGSWLVAGSNAVLHASLSSAFLSLRQVDISSALGMNALQSRSTSGVHAVRCARVPCEKEGVGETVADNRASDTHHRVKVIGRSIRLSFGFPCSSHPQSESTLDIVIMADRNTLVPQFVLVAKRQRLELSTPLQCFRVASGGQARVAVRSVSRNIGCARTTKSSHVRPSVGTNTNANGPC
jgi:hypothetical protein